MAMLYSPEERIFRDRMPDGKFTKWHIMSNRTSFHLSSVFTPFTAGLSVSLSCMYWEVNNKGESFEIRDLFVDKNQVCKNCLRIKGLL